MLMSFAGAQIRHQHPQINLKLVEVNNNNKESMLAAVSSPSSSSSFAVCTCRLGVEEFAAGIANNKVLVCSAVGVAFGQLCKPFSSGLQGKGFDLKAAVTSGGMPSSHSSGVVAAAMAIGLERGFSDSVFGLSVVFAAIVMYDAQGVRKEVGIHAKIINSILIDNKENMPSNSMDRFAGASQSSSEIDASSSKIDEFNARNVDEPKAGTSRTLILNKSATTDNEHSEVRSGGEPPEYRRLKESVGHTEAEVFAGALLGFIVAMGLDWILW